jgi:MoaA/NifB/PqqE/SkfB family radical SAM enzyme
MPFQHRNLEEPLDDDTGRLCQLWSRVIDIHTLDEEKFASDSPAEPYGLSATKEKHMLQVFSDPRFDQHFGGRLMQVFLYVTDECNLRCTQCYYKPWLKIGHAEMPTDVIVALLHKFRQLGAVKVSFLGGEPTLYGHAEGNESLPFIVHSARDLGFEYIRVVSNGLFDEALLSDDRLREVDEITFSIDGDTADIHNALRGRNTYARSLANLRKAVDLGFNVQVTMCVHKGNIDRDENGRLILDRSISWAQQLGAKSMNFHPVFRMGIARDSWTGDVHVSPSDWLAVYKEIRTKIERGQYGISVRAPLRFATNSEFEERSGYYGYCPVKLAERLEIHQNGQMHSCALHNGTPISIAKFERRGDVISIGWSPTDNEFEKYPFKEGEDHPCVVMRGFSEEVRPLCISLKPAQDEFVWKRMSLG